MKRLCVLAAGAVLFSGCCRGPSYVPIDPFVFGRTTVTSPSTGTISPGTDDPAYRNMSGSGQPSLPPSSDWQRSSGAEKAPGNSAAGPSSSATSSGGGLSTPSPMSSGAAGVPPPSAKSPAGAPPIANAPTATSPTAPTTSPYSTNTTPSPVPPPGITAPPSGPAAPPTAPFTTPPATPPISPPTTVPTTPPAPRPTVPTSPFSTPPFRGGATGVPPANPTSGGSFAPAALPGGNAAASPLRSDAPIATSRRTVDLPPRPSAGINWENIADPLADFTIARPDGSAGAATGTASAAGAVDIMDLPNVRSGAGQTPASTGFEVRPASAIEPLGGTRVVPPPVFSRPNPGF